MLESICVNVMFVSVWPFIVCCAGCDARNVTVDGICLHTQSASQSPLTVPASPASCQSNIWREDLQNTLAHTHTVVTSLYSAAQRKQANYVCLVVTGMSGNRQYIDNAGQCRACVRPDLTLGQLSPKSKQEDKLYKFILNYKRLCHSLTHSLI